ncbi:toll/interleukin-1 receptor domain-containing protein [Qipengyuania gelatinilytica]|uniref:TIR domain-containing protein n=1 Tax=Qipengyuania gelatinilytica TaxID=2867231 RepID=A0ABX9A281_9SPHN|nr:toll/interleukin-1 receptor domain-containing protein [Qipengyuania gelatinilytica]QZD93952.1 TIR domain-containing protein [Qipengyuania gelatinilytica]
MAERRYKAFISYSHRDKRIANWLHGQLENFKLPDGIDAPGLEDGLRPIFKDREELPASEDLGAALESALSNSDALIVLCSPHSAISPWIAKEIDLFKRVNGDARVFPAVVDGAPPYNMPPPLLVHYEDGTPTEELAEPIAADLRPEEDGRKLGVQKLVAGLAGIGLDELVDRQARQRHRRLAIMAAASFVGMVIAIGLALFALQQRDTAREERAEANGLIEYMLTDLREELEPVGRLDVMDGVGARAMEYYARQKLDDLSPEELGRRARAVQLVAEMHNLRGNNDKALPAFREAARTTSELLARKPDDPERMFNHGQSMFWVGLIAWQRGQMDEAKKALGQYADISIRLAAKDRSNLVWQLEEAYALSNLGTLADEEARYEDALDLFERSVATVARVAEAEGRPASRLVEWGQGLSWVSSTHQVLGDFRAATETRERELALYNEALEAEPNHAEARRMGLFAKGSMGALHSIRGQTGKARQYLDDAAAEAETLIEQDPENTMTKVFAIGVLQSRAMVNWNDGRSSLATADYDRAEALLLDLKARDPKNLSWNVERPASLELERALTDQSGMAPERLRAVARKWLGRLDQGDPAHVLSIIAAHLVEANAHSKSGDGAKAAASYARAIAVESIGQGFHPVETALRAVAAERLGQTALARQLRRSLEEKELDPVIDNRIA